MLTFHASIETLLADLQAHPVNTNPFFLAFKDRRLSHVQMRQFVRQYHYFCFHFVKLLEGLLYRTPVHEIEMRIELTKTLYSEMGSGSTDHIHIRYLERFAQAIGLDEADLHSTVPIASVTAYLKILARLFLHSSYLTALGAELAVEMTAASEFRYFHPGLQKYGAFSKHDLEFFDLHASEEVLHSDWLIQAVHKTAKTSEDIATVAAGAHETADAWLAFWNGMYRHIFETVPSSPASPSLA